MSSPLRVGSVPYLVGRPLDQGLGDEPGIELSHDVPARLVEKLRAGEIDVALVSSIELFRRPGYRYLSGIAVTGRGFVSSVQVFLRKPLADVRSVALDPASRAAQALARVLLEREDRRFVEVPEGEDARRAGTDAWLRIGDRALREFLEPGARPVFNPSEAWTQRTGLPFVFAPWIVRPGVEVGAAVDAFARARARGKLEIQALAEEASRQFELPLEPCLRYLSQECRYEIGDEMEPALLAFRDAAAPLGLVRGDLLPEPIGGAASTVG